MNLFGEDFSQLKKARPIYPISQDTKAMLIANSTHKCVPLLALYQLHMALVSHDITV